MKGKFLQVFIRGKKEPLMYNEEFWAEVSNGILQVCIDDLDEDGEVIDNYVFAAFAPGEWKRYQYISSEGWTSHE